jgi:hypothetical protein
MLQNPVAFSFKWQLNIATFYARNLQPSRRVLVSRDFSFLNHLDVALVGNERLQ